MSGGARAPRGTVAVVFAAMVVPAAGAAPAGAEVTADELARSVQPLRPVVDDLRPGRTTAMQERRAGVASLQADVLFDFDGDRVRPAGRRAVVRLAAGVARSGTTLRVVGYTDGVGSAAYNRALSRRRAAAVARLLRARVPAGVRIVAQGRGSEDPVAEETTASGDDDPSARARNRRVELRVAGR